MKDPIVIDPPGFDPRAGWKECSEYVEKCGGLTHDDGSVNWRAAFGADPGCCSCPHCRQYYWSFGRVIECTDCQFRFPTDWWPAYSWGVQARRREDNPPPAYRDEYIRSSMRKRHNQSIGHPYYRYGYEHPVDDAWAEHDKIPWREVVGSMDKYPENVRLGC